MKYLLLQELIRWKIVEFVEEWRGGGEGTVGGNIIGAPKMRNRYGGIK